MSARRSVVLAVWLALALSVLAVAQSELVNPDDVTYDPQTGAYYDASGAPTEPPPVPDFLRNRGYRRMGGALLDPSGQVVDPATLYPSPETNANPDRVHYDPATGQYYDRRGEPTSAPMLPRYLQDRGFQQDRFTGEIFDPEGHPVDLSTLYPAPPDRDTGVRYDPVTKKYYGPGGQHVPAGDFGRINEGWREDPKTGEWIDPQGGRHDPSTLYPPPDPLDNPLDLSYDPVSGKYFDADGNPVEGDLPQFMKDQGYRLDPATGRITDPTGARVDPTTLFDAPEANPGRVTYDPKTRRYYNSMGTARVSLPDLPPYMEARGYRLDHRSGEIIDPDGNRASPATLYPAPSGGLGLIYDPQTGKFYGGQHEAPPSLPQYMEDRGWRYNPASGKFLDPNGSPVDPNELFDTPQLDLPTPPSKPTPATGSGNTFSFVDPAPPGDLWGAPVNLGSGLVDFGGTSYPEDGSLALRPVGGSAFTNASPLDLEAANAFVSLGPETLNVAAASSAGREASVQVMIVMFLDGTVPGSRRAQRGGRMASLVPSVPPSGSGPPLRATLRALGVSSGEAFDVEVANEEAYPVELSAAGVVVEPLRARDGSEVLEELERAGEPALRLKADGYCLEYERQPPPEGMVFRVAGPELQRRYQPMRSVLRAAKKLLDEGGLTPDSDPEQYFHSIVQWALWSKEQGFDETSFAKAFLDRTRKNFEAARQPFTGEIEATVRSLAPNRWKDVSSVLARAESFLPLMR